MFIVSINIFGKTLVSSGDMFIYAPREVKVYLFGCVGSKIQLTFAVCKIYKYDQSPGIYYRGGNKISHTCKMQWTGVHV